MNVSFTPRIRRSLSYAVALLAVLLCPAAQGNIFYSGTINVSIPLTFDGVYFNPLSGSTTTSEPGTWGTAPWFNPYFGGSEMFNNSLFNAVTTASGGTQVENLGFGTMVDGTSDFAGDFNVSDQHVGLAVDQFQLGTPGYIGFSFQDGVGGSTYYGWMNVDLSNTGSGTIISYAYDTTPNTGIQAGQITAVPEPGSMFIVLGCVGCAMLRRRRVSLHPKNT